MKSFLFASVLICFVVVPCLADPLPVPAVAALPLPSNIDAVISTGKDSKFKTLQEAVDAAPDNATKPYVILLKAGRYRWQQTLIPKSKRFIQLVGENPATTTISFHLNVYETLKERHLEKLEGITLIAQGDDFQATNLTIENVSGDHGQALALRLDGDRCVVRNCRLLGWQDTVMTNDGRHYFRDCYIEGRVDFIFGSGTAFFENCELRSKNGGYVTAASTPEEKPFGYVFSHCKLTADPTPWEPEASNKKPPLAFLGRPWRPHASVIFLQCEMGSHIHPDGWNNWGKTDNEKTARYAEYRSTGPGAKSDSRVKWSRQLADEQAKVITAENVLRGSDGWNPAKP